MKQTSKTFLFLLISGVLTTTLIIGLGSALLPLLISFCLAYLSFPLIIRIEKFGIQRSYSVGGVFTIIIAFLTLILALIVPNLIKDGTLFLKEFPQTSTAAIEKVEILANKLGYKLNFSNQGLKDFILNHSSEISGDLLKSGSIFLKSFFSNFIGGILFILNLFLIPLFYFHLMNKYETILKEAKSLVPISWRPKMKEYVHLSNTVLNGYIRGQILVSLILASLYGFGFLIIGLRFGLLIGIFTGLLSIIPFVGSILGFSVAMAMALANFTGIETVISVGIVFIIIQGLESLLITPKLVGDKVGLGVLSTMLSLIIGGNLFGFIGMIVAIPIAAILKTIFKDLKKEYQKLNIYNQPLF